MTMTLPSEDAAMSEASWPIWTQFPAASVR